MRAAPAVCPYLEKQSIKYFIIIKISNSPGDDIDHAGREADLECEAGEVERGEGSLLGRLGTGTVRRTQEIHGKVVKEISGKTIFDIRVWSGCLLQIFLFREILLLAH